MADYVCSGLDCNNALGFRGFCSKRCHDGYYDSYSHDDVGHEILGIEKSREDVFDKIRKAAKGMTDAERDELGAEAIKEMFSEIYTSPVITKILKEGG